MAVAAPPWGLASEHLHKAGVVEDSSYYREFTGADQKAALTVAMRIQAAWADNDADAFADTFAENGSLLMQDEQLTSREQIRSYMSKGFAGPLRGARVKGWPVAIRFLGDDVAMLITEGGIIPPGDQEVRPERLIRATWVVVRRASGSLELVSHHSSPVKS